MLTRRKRMVVTAKIEKLEDGKLVLKPDTDISRFVEQKRPRRVEVRLDDGRTISVDQRRKIFAIIRDKIAQRRFSRHRYRYFPMSSVCVSRLSLVGTPQWKQNEIR